MNERIREKSDWRTWDTNGDLFFPWYTRTFLEELIKWNIKNWKVFEYGAGDSTEWWRRNSGFVVSVDTNKEWSEKTQTKFISNKQEFLESPLSFCSKNKDKFDCIIIDSEPVEWRDQCTEYALQAIKKGGIIIIDNYEQDSIGLSKTRWELTDKFLFNYEKHVFKEPNHEDWKTAYWIIK